MVLAREEEPTSAVISRLARLARETLGCDGVVVITSTGADGLDAAGVDPVRPDQVRAELATLQEAAPAGERIRVEACEGLGAPAATFMLREGFTTAMWLPFGLDGEALGTLYLLARGRSDFGDLRLAAAFAGHCAVAAAQERRQERGPSERGERADELDRLLLSAGDLAAFTRGLEDVLAPYVGSVRTGLMVWDKALDVLQTLPGFFRTSPETAASYQVDLRVCESNSARVFASGASYLSNDPQNDAGLLQEWVAFFRPARIVSIPLRVADRRMGVLHVSDKTTPFTVADLQVLEGLAPRIGKALGIMQELLRARRLQALERLLSDVALKVISGASMNDTLSSALDEARVVVEAEIVTLNPVGGPAIGRSRRRVTSAHVDDALRHAATQPDFSSSFTRPRRAGDSGSATLHIPVDFGPQRVGTLSAVRLRGQPFDPDERGALRRLSQLVALTWAADRYRSKRDEIVRLRERHRIADDLHDHVAQVLFVAQMALDTIVEEHGDLSDSLTHVRGLLTQGDVAIREVISQLSSSPEGELGDRLMAVVERAEQEFGLPVKLQVHDAIATVAGRVRAPVADALVRVASESLTNAGKHAGPCHAVVDLLPREQELVLTVIDDGLGLTERGGPTADGHGLRSLRRLVKENGGTLRVRRAAAGGMSVRASFPLPTR
jgi:signal transduction histidine kinase